MFDNLEDGVSVGEFPELFPGVTLAQARLVLEHAARSASSLQAPIRDGVCPQLNCLGDAINTSSTMLNIVRCATLIIALSGCASQFEKGARLDHGDVVHFYGDIDADSVSKFIDQHRNDSIRRVVVDSNGGDVAEGIRLAMWIADHDADVEVRGMCGSSCANYVFSAGHRKIIGVDSLVVWHGSVLQKNFRDACEPKSNKATDKALQFSAEACAAWRDLVDRQTSFFKRVGVDESITRLGQEPRNFAADWTAPVSVMKRFGLNDVEADRDYGSQVYLRPWNHGNDEHPIISLGFDEDGEVVELAR